MLDTTIYYEVDRLGSITIAIHKKTHDLHMLIQTEAGLVNQALKSERASQLGIALIRAGGQTWNFPEEEKDDAKNCNCNHGSDDLPRGPG